MGRPFTASRSDGRSDRRVVFELVQDAEPDTSFFYDELIAALSDGLDEEVPRERVYRAVTAANRTLLREKKRCLTNVADVGYRVVRSDEHLSLALRDKDKSQTYIKRGIEKLRHVRLNELDSNIRALTEGQLMILVGLDRAVQESDRRHDKAESLIDELKQRVDRLEGQS